MHFLLNFSLSPFFLSLGNLEKGFESIEWEHSKSGPEGIWNFLEEHSKDLPHLQWVGGITGPGSFSSLRVNALILEILSQKYKITLRSCRADKLVEAYLKAQKIRTPFCLNAFGNQVFISHTDAEELELISLETLREKIPGKIFTGFLPPEKQEGLNGISEPIDTSLLQECLAEILQKSPDSKSFIPYYGHAGV